MNNPENGRHLWEEDALHPSTRLYVQSRQIATSYDDFFRSTALFRFDTQILDRYIEQPGRLIDFGCGTGRHLIHFANKGFPALGLDMSAHMLQCAQAKAAQHGARLHLVRGAFQQMDFLHSASFRYAICMFSTIGIIRGKANRQRFAAQVRRILIPGGLFVFHVHNRWLNLLDPFGRRWLLETHTINRLRGLECGDKIMDGYRGIPNMFLHVFTLREATRLAIRAGFRIRDVVFMTRRRDAELTGHWRAVRSNGFIIVAEAV